MADRFTDEKLENVMERITAESNQRLIYFEITPGQTSIFQSKIGGLPYMPKEACIPQNENGEELCFFGQFLFDDMPTADINLPKTGLLQVWLLNNANNGADCYTVKCVETSLSKQLFYYPSLDKTITEAEIRAKYRPPVGKEKDSTFPVRGEFVITYYEGEQTHHYSSDNDYTEQFIKIWNELYPEEVFQDEEEFYDFVSEKLEDMDEFDPDYGNQLGGYPHFFSEDERKEENGLADYKVTLLAMDGDVIISDDVRICFAPGAAVYFFITEENLDKRDFSKIFYTWTY